MLKRKSLEITISNFFVIVLLMFSQLLVAQTIPGVEWAKSIGGRYADQGIDFTMDNMGNHYVTGGFSNTIDLDPSAATANFTSNGGSDIILAKYDSVGNYIYGFNIGGNTHDQGLGVAADNSGNVYITGYFTGTVDFDPDTGTTLLTSYGNAEIFVAKYDANGSLVFAFSVGAGNNDRGEDIAVDANGNFYITGSFNGAVDFDHYFATWYYIHSNGGSTNAFVAKYDSSANIKYAISLGGYNTDVGKEIEVDAYGNAYVLGTFGDVADFDPAPISSASLTSNGFADVFIAKYDTAGNYIYAKSFGNSNNDAAYGLDIDTIGNTYITGSFRETVDFNPGPNFDTLTSNGSNDIYLAKFDSNGDYDFALSIGGSDNDLGQDVEVDNNGDIYITGFIRDTVDFDPDTGTSNFIVSNLNLFLAKYSNTGKYIYAFTTGPSLNYARAVYLDDEDVFLWGLNNGTVDFDPSPNTYNLTSNGSSDIFFAKYSSDISVSLSCPADTVVNNSIGLCGAIVNYTNPVVTGGYLNQIAGLPSGAFFPVGTTTLTFAAVSSTGNTDTCGFTVTVVDAELPIISTPRNIYLANNPGQCGATASYAAPSFSDNCPGATLNQTAGLASGSFFPIGTTQISYQVTDAAGNIAISNFLVWVFDFEDPVITCGGDITVNTDPGQCNAVVTYPYPSASDNCPGATTLRLAGLSSGSNFPKGTTTVAYGVTDASNRRATCYFRVTVIDNEGPTINCLSNYTVNNDSGLCGAYVNYTVPTATDNCGWANVTQVGGSNPSGSFFPIGKTYLLFQATDGSGNRNTCSFYIDVLDTEAPSINCPADVTLVSDSNCSTIYYGPTASVFDHCSATTLTSVPSLPATFYGPGDHTIVYTVTDADGNTNSCTQTVTVNVSIIADAGADSYVIINSGSGPAPLPCTTLSASATGGVGALSYNWSPAAGLSSTVGAAPTACPTVTTMYYVTVTDAGACASVDSVMVTVVDLNDPNLPHVGNNTNKIYVCYNGNTVEANANADCSSVNSLCYYLLNGASVGPCNNKTNLVSDKSSLTTTLKAYPNPFSKTTTLDFKIGTSGTINLELFDMKGTLVKSLFSGHSQAGEAQQINFNATHLNHTMYIVRLTTATEVKHLKLLLLQ